MSTVGVVIPFYQRDGELVRKALASVARQALPPDTMIRIFLVDDESPFPSAEVLGRLPHDFPVPITALSQKNAGPGAARNAGLRAARDHGVDYVAFLDSDDIWYPGHIETALSMLSEEATFYFSNGQHDAVDAMFYNKYIARHHQRGDDRYCPERRVADAGEFLDALLDECIPHTSQVVYDLKRHPDIRFKHHFRRAAEDHTCWIEIVGQAKKVAYSTTVFGERGRGVSIYRDTLNWDLDTAGQRVLEEIAFRRSLLVHYGDRPGCRAMLDANLTRRELSIIFLAARGVHKAPLKAISVLARAASSDPRILLRLPSIVLQLPSYYRDLKAGRAAV